nr:MAG TPA: hypothetical protein [Caudoviricetes sp.]
MSLDCSFLILRASKTCSICLTETKFFFITENTHHINDEFVCYFSIYGLNYTKKIVKIKTIFTF